MRTDFPTKLPIADHELPAVLTILVQRRQRYGIMRCTCLLARIAQINWSAPSCLRELTITCVWPLVHTSMDLAVRTILCHIYEHHAYRAAAAAAARYWYIVLAAALLLPPRGAPYIHISCGDGFILQISHVSTCSRYDTCMPD